MFGAGGEKGSPQEEVRRRLEALTGFAHPVFFQTGTAAIEAVIALLAPPRGGVAVPAFGCWTIPFAVTKARRQPEFCDIDRYWAARVRAVRGSLAILIDPWGGCADWRQAARCATTEVVADMTLSPGARLGGELPARWFRAGVFSLGAGKPLSIGGGGVALFRDEGLAREARRMFRFGFHDGRWAKRLDRYAFSPHLFPVLLDRLCALPGGQRAHEGAVDARAALTGLGLGLTSNGLRAGASWGVANTLPICLPNGFPLTARDVEGVAISTRFPLARHPVTPAYLQPAWARRSEVKCPRAEDVASRCLFFKPAGRTLNELGELISRVVAAPDEFRTPFPLPRARRDTLPREIEDLATTARLVRDVERRYWLFDERDSLMWPLQDGEAAIVQARSRQRSSPRAGPRGRGGLHSAQGQGSASTQAAASALAGK